MEFGPAQTNSYNRFEDHLSYPNGHQIGGNCLIEHSSRCYLRTAAGQTLELYPMADVVVAPGVFFGPRIFFPVAVSNSVFDAPKKVDMNNVQPELYLQATL